MKKNLMLKLNRILQGDGKPVGPKNANHQYFSGEPLEKIDRIVRETIQNPLDHPFDEGKPVKVVFKEIYAKVYSIPQKDELLKTMDSLIIELRKQKKSDKGIIATYLAKYENAKRLLNGDSIRILQISDYNTSGLTGSIKDVNSILGRFLGGFGYLDDGSGGGGSGGLGKLAPFLASKLNFCFYSSLNKDGEYLYYGWGDYFTYELANKKYRPEINIVIENSDVLKLNKRMENCGFLSERDEQGTDVFALGFDKIMENGLWQKEMVKAVIRNYFGAIIDKKLEVEIHEFKKAPIIINATSLNDNMLFFDEGKKTNRGSDLLADGIVVESVKAYVDGNMFSEILPILGKCTVKLKLNEEYQRYITYMRGPRMLIFSKKKSLGDLPFAGIFATDNSDGNDMLRITEDSHHTKWNFEDAEKGRAIQKEIKEFIDRCIKEYCSHDSEDEFEILGTGLLSFGSKSKGKGDAREEPSEEPTATIYPKNIVSAGEGTTTRGGSWKVDSKGRKKKVQPKKPKYKKKGIKVVRKKPTTKKREYRVEEFEAMMFKNDSVLNEYHLFIDSDINTDIRTINFSIKEAEDVIFINEITDSTGNTLAKDTRKEAGLNAFENFILKAGKNKFVVKTKFDKKMEIIIQ